MYTLIIADKQQESIDKITAVVSSLPDINITGTARSTQELSRLLHETDADIVICDVALDGGSSLDIIREQPGRNTQFILYTNQTDFEIAYQAIQLHVTNYILKSKPLSHLQQALAELLDKQQTQARALYSKIRYQFLQDLRIGEFNLTSIEQVNKIYETSFQEGCFRGMLLKLDCPKDQEEYATLINPEFFDTLAATINQQCRALSHELLFDYMSGSVFALVNYDERHREAIQAATETIFHKAKAQCERIRNSRITLCVSREYKSIKHIGKIKGDVLDARWLRLTVGTNKIIHQDQASEYYQELSLSMINQLRHYHSQIIQACDVLDTEKCRDFIRDFFAMPNAVLVTREGRTLIKETINHLFDDMYFKFISTDAQAQKLKMKLIYDVNMSPSFHEMGKTLSDKMTEILRQVSDTLNVQYSKPVRDAISYIGHNFGQPLSLNFLANEVHLTPAYFSGLFHRETGETLTNYIVAHRMNVAKTLFENNVLNVSEVAREVGYDDVRYFGKTFKKIVGILPSEYKKIVQAKMKELQL